MTDNRLRIAVACFVACISVVYGVGSADGGACGEIGTLVHYMNAETAHRVNESTRMVAKTLGSVRLPTFHSVHLEQTPMYLQRKNSDYFSQLFDVAAVDSVLSSNTSAYTAEAGFMRHGLDWKLVKRVVDDQGEEWSATVAKEFINISEAHDYYDQGWSVVINKMEHRWPSIARFSQAIEDIFGPRVQVNLYLTPPGAQAFEPHFDWMDGFILQLHGEKHWKVFDTAVLQPRPDMRFKPSASDMEALGEPLAELLLTTGDVLYIPAGFVHSAETKRDESSPNEPSLHLTFGIEVGTHYSWEILLHYIVEAGFGMAECAEGEARHRESWSVRCINGQHVVDLPLRCVGEEQADNCQQTCSLPLQLLSHHVISYLAAQPEAWGLRRVVPITEAMRILGCGTLGFHSCVLQALTAHVNVLVTMLSENYDIADVLAHGNYSGLYSHWKQSGTISDEVACTVSAKAPANLAKRTDVFPHYLADLLTTMHNEHAALTPCFASLVDSRSDISRCVATQDTLPSFMACALEAMTFVDVAATDDADGENDVILVRTSHPVVTAGWKMFMENILREKQQREASVHQSLVSNAAHLRQTASS